MTQQLSLLLSFLNIVTDRFNGWGTPVARTRAIVAYSRATKSDASDPRVRMISIAESVKPMTIRRSFEPGRQTL